LSSHLGISVEETTGPAALSISYLMIWTELHNHSQSKFELCAQSVRASILPWKRKVLYVFWVCVCGLRYPACNTQIRMRLIVVCGQPALLYLPRYFINGTIFKKNVWNIKVCSDFLYKFVLNIFDSKKNWDRDDHKFILVSM
jgi:hypothetical protein